MSRIFDNIDGRDLGNRIRESLQEATHLDVAVGYFNLRGWSLFSDSVDQRAVTDGEGPMARILIGMALDSSHREDISKLERELVRGLRGEAADIDNSTATPRAVEVIHQLQNQLMRGLPTNADRETLRTLRRQLSDGLVQVKAFTARPLHGKAYIVHRSDHVNPVYAYVGSSNLTPGGLLHNYELNVEVVDSSDAEQLEKWFEDRWKDPFNVDLTTQLLELLDQSWVSPIARRPYDVYLKLCYDMSADVRDGVAEYSLPTALNDRLLDFQREAVKTLARRVHRRGGTMLGDVVGMGKTLTAIAVAAVMRDEYGYSTLVVCPKNLTKMWEKHLDTYQLHSKVVPYSQAGNVLPELSRYQFVIVDESHTMRNPKRQDYQALRSYIERNASKVLLLTATPYNTGFDDVASQLGLWIGEDDDLGIEPTTALRANPNLLTNLDGRTRTLNAFRKSDEPEDWRRLMSDHLVRRTRTFVKRAAELKGQVDEQGPYLELTNGAKFHFPQRVSKIKQHAFGDDDPAARMAADTTLDAIRSLTLPRYRLAHYRQNDGNETDEERDVLDRLGQGRGQVAGFVRTSLYKRLSSCGYSLDVSLRRHIARNELMVHAITHDRPLPVGTIQDSMFTGADSDSYGNIEDEQGLTPEDQNQLSLVAERQYNALFERKPPNVEWIRPSVFAKELRQDLDADTEVIKGLLEKFGDWKSESDSKLAALITLLTQDHPEEKVLIFTEYQDTANYLYAELTKRGLTHVGLATGSTDDPTAVATRFSPRSGSHTQGPNLRTALPIDEQFRVLIATDVLSEGQNLQDSHIVVNYDLPWAIIRLIQRAGRVDRIGQESDTVLVYSFVHDSVEEVLNLRTRIASRLSDHASTFGSDEEFFGSPSERSALQQMYDGSLDAIESIEGVEGEVDAASLAFQEWSSAIARDPELETRIPGLPDLLHATRPGPPPLNFGSGVAFFVRTESGLETYAYADSTGTRLVTANEALTLFKAVPETPPATELHEHNELLASAILDEDSPLNSANLSEGRLLPGVRKRVWNRLRGTFDELQPESRDAIDALYRFPLTSHAERRLRRALREQPQDLASIVTALHRGAELVMSSRIDDPLRIVSSMGIAHE